MALAVENHPQRAEIIDWLSQGEDPATVAAKLQPPLHRTTVWRFDRTRRTKIQEAAQMPSALVSALEERGILKEGAPVAEIARAIATATEQRLAADPYLARIAKHQQTIDESLQDARKDKDGRTVAALIGTDLKGLELDARLTGRLDASTNGAQHIYIVSDNVTINAPEPARDDVKIVDV